MLTNRSTHLCLFLALVIVMALVACAPPSQLTSAPNSAPPATVPAAVTAVPEVSPAAPTALPTIAPTEILTQVPTPVSVETGQPEPTGTSPSFPEIADSEPLIATQPHRQHLLLVGPDGSNPQDILTQLPFEQFHPDWSPDGSKLVFEHAPEGPDADVRDIWISDANGDNAEPLLTEYPQDLDGLFWSNPAWSRDGRSIAMVGYQGNASMMAPVRSVITFVDIASREISVVSEYALADGNLQSYPRWSPDGNGFVFVLDHFEGEEFLGGAIAVIRRSDAGWSEPTLITKVGDWTDRPDWHPTEDLILFSTYDYGNWRETDDPSNLFTIRPDGTELTQITKFGAGEERATQASWTPDGRIIFTYVSGTADERQSPAFINADGTGLEVLTGLEDLVHSRLRPTP